MRGQAQSNAIQMTGKGEGDLAAACAPTVRVQSVSTRALFDWGMGLGAALYQGHGQSHGQSNGRSNGQRAGRGEALGHGPVAPRCCGSFDPDGRPPTS